jgi:hypothetical protein
VIARTALSEPSASRAEGFPAVSGCFPGTVVNDEDPNREGRLRVRVDQIYGAADESEKIEDVDLPWALPAFQTAGEDAGEPWTPPVGAGVWVMFWAGNPRHPVWFGGYYGTGEVPAEFSGSYSPSPKTRVVKTDSGHLIEMRWVDGQSYIKLLTADGFQVLLNDSTRRARVSTPGQREMTLDDLAQSATLKTPTQSIELLDATQTINVVTPGNAVLTAGGTINATAGGALTATATGMSFNSLGGAPVVQVGGGALTSTFAGAALYTFLGTLTYAITGALAITAASAQMTFASILIAVTGGAATLMLGSAAGVKRRLVDERIFATLADIAARFNTHTHSGGVGAPGVPEQIPVASPGNAVPAYDTNLLATINTVAD